MRPFTQRPSVPKFATEAKNIRQIGALPYRSDANGDVEVMLITSRETRRWVIPKGNPIAGLAPHEAAAQEAYEEAGVRGIASPEAIGEYAYVKRHRMRADRDLIVTVFPLAFTEQLVDWPERGQRDTRWFPLEQAAALVDESDLRTLIERFRAPAAIG